MVKHPVPSLVFLYLLVACSPADRAFEPKDAEAIRLVMEDQEGAWGRGDIRGFMAGYSDTICFLGPSGMTCGREAVTGNYLRKYPDREAMGVLSFGIHELLPAGPDHAWTTGTWALHRTADTLSGAFSLLWAREVEGWRIVRDHTH